MPIQSVNPATEDIFETFEAYNDVHIETALQRAHEAFLEHRKTTFEDRMDGMRQAAEILENEVEEHALNITREMGKPIEQAKAEVKKCASVCRFYADNAKSLLVDHHVQVSEGRAYIRYLPIGPILAVMPWNFPYWQVFRFAAPALMAGNTGLLKHASNVPKCALAIEDVLHRAGFDNGEFQTLLIASDKVKSIIEDDRIRAVTLTGSEGAGRAVAAAAGKAIKKTVLELGGSDAFIVMPSADMNRAVEMAVKGRTQNTGQSCIASKRFIIHADIYNEFRDKLAAAFEDLKIGNPEDPDTDIGPLSSAQIRDELDEQVQKTLSQGARRICGAEKINGKGFFYKPGLIENIPMESPAYSEEFFGPVGLLFEVENLDNAIALANDTRFGLGSAIFTNDNAEIEQAANQLDAGATFVNDITASAPNLPFGGVKASGYGRELSEEGIKEFMNIKTIVVK